VQKDKTFRLTNCTENSYTYIPKS